MLIDDGSGDGWEEELLVETWADFEVGMEF